MNKYLRNYPSKSDYDNDLNKPKDSSSVSLAGEDVEYDGVNRTLPLSAAGSGIICIMVLDKVKGERRLIPEALYDAAALDSSRYVCMNYVTFGSVDGEGVAIHKNSPWTSALWAVPNYYMITPDLAQAGSFNWSVTVNGSAKSGSVSWSAGATIDSLVSQMTAVASYFVAKGNKIGVTITAYSGTEFTISNASNATIENYAKLYTKVAGVAQSETHRSFQTMSVASMFASLGWAGSTTDQYAKNGYNLSFKCGGNLAKFKSYVNANGSAVYVADNDTTTYGMKESAFNALAESTVEAEIALYNKYGGSWDAYMKARMYKLDFNGGVDRLYYNNGLEMTAKLASITTKNLDGDWVAAYPAAYNAYNHSVVVGGETLVAANEAHLPTNHEIAMFMEDSMMAAINRALAKIGGTALTNSGYYWSVSEFSANSAWYYNGYIGTVYGSSEYNTSQVRPVLAFALK